ncbi:GH25 family lysozyme [Beijerinckia sp. L45]|uniref:glycoside hydrolase family 25 protein n=1 Tax=Beijerinckia sp. L45 TaxID=1641855 RepID=UPI00131BEB1F|nr:GH25 family lysozyme [Beijerinckia sp. L45]
MSTRVPPKSRSVLRRCLSTVAVAATMLGVAGCASSINTSDPYPHAMDFAIQGIDVSKYQGDVDWSAVYNSGVQFAWIKATEGGDYLDEKFRQNWEMARAAGLRRGAYHFIYWCRPAREQAAWFLANVPNDPMALPPVLDVEWNEQSKTCPHHIPREQALETMQIILDAMEQAYGKRPVIYTSVDFHRDVLNGEFMSYPIWVRSVKTYPTVKYGNRRWHFWQHTAQGAVPGVHGYVDRNAFYGSVTDWQNWLQPNPQG